MRFKRIFVEDGARNYPLASAILQKLPEVERQTIANFQELANLEFKEGKRSLACGRPVWAERQGRARNPPGRACRQAGRNFISSRPRAVPMTATIAIFRLTARILRPSFLLIPPIYLRQLKRPFGNFVTRGPIFTPENLAMRWSSTRLRTFQNPS